MDTKPPTPTSHPLPSLPPPQTFDILPPLHALLTRVVPPPSGLQPPSNNDPADIKPTSLNLASSADATTNAANTRASGDGHIEIQHLAAEASGVRVRIQKARLAVKGMPDVERGVEEQREEMRALEARVEELRGILGGLGER